MNNCGFTKKSRLWKTKRVQEKGVTIYMLIIFMTKNSCIKKKISRDKEPISLSPELVTNKSFILHTNCIKPSPSSSIQIIKLKLFFKRC